MALPTELEEEINKLSSIPHLLRADFRWLQEFRLSQQILKTDLSAGDIVYLSNIPLTTSDKLIAVLCSGEPGQARRNSNHPVVILDSTISGAAKVRVGVMRTFNGKGVYENEEIADEDKQYILAIGTQQRHEGSGVRLLKHQQVDARMRKQGYVDTRSAFDVSTLLLSTYDSSKPLKHYSLNLSSVDLMIRTAAQWQVKADGERQPMETTLVRKGHKADDPSSKTVTPGQTKLVEQVKRLLSLEGLSNRDVEWIEGLWSHPISVQQDNVAPGDLLWIKTFSANLSDKLLNELCSANMRRMTTQDGLGNHPCVVIELLAADKVRVCEIRTFSGKDPMRIKQVRMNERRYIASIGTHIDNSNTKVHALEHANPRNQTNKPSYVDCRSTFDISLLALRKYADNRPINYHRLDQPSIHYLQQMTLYRSLEQRERERRVVELTRDKADERQSKEENWSAEQIHEKYVEAFAGRHDSLECREWFMQRSLAFDPAAYTDCGVCWQYLRVQKFKGFKCMNRNCLCRHRHAQSSTLSR